MMRAVTDRATPGVLRPAPVPPPETSSERVRAARARTAAALEAQRRRLVPLRWALAAVVVAFTVTTSPRPGLHGQHLAVAACLAGYLVGVIILAARPVPRWLEVTLLEVIVAAGVGSAIVQPQAASELVVGSGVWLASLRLPARTTLAVTVPATAGLAAAMSAGRAGTQDAVASVLLCVVLATVGRLLRRSRDDQERMAVLLARLEDAGEAEAAAAAAAERGRIAGDLHDVLAHSLSGLAIQLEGARQLARRDGAGEELRAVLDRAALLAKDGLAEARRAVGALRGEDQPTLDHLEDLVVHYRRDLGLPAGLVVEGTPRPVPLAVGTAVYRAAAEALTNVVRHAPGAPTSVTVDWAGTALGLTVDNAAGGPSLAPGGRGWGLAGIRERVESVGGSCHAGPTPSGWRLQIAVPLPSPEGGR